MDRIAGALFPLIALAAIVFYVLCVIWAGWTKKPGRTGVTSKPDVSRETSPDPAPLAPGQSTDEKDS